MKNLEVIEMFVGGRFNEKGTKNLTIKEGKLKNHNTVIGQWAEGTLFINNTKYSSSTSTIQNKLVSLAENELSSDRVVLIGDLPMGVTSIAYADIL